MTSFGYVKVESKFLADRIWSRSSNWESLIKKEVENLLSKYGHEISYADIRHLNKNWTNDVTINTNQILPSTLSSGKSIHVVIDNSDGKH